MSQSEPKRHNECDELLPFEKLLPELLSRFVNVSASEVDREIEDAQRRICESLDIDILAVWQLSNEDSAALTATHYYSNQQGPQPPGLLKQEDFPWFVKQLQAGRIVAVSSLEEMPAEAAHDREVCRQLGIKSNLSIPLSVGGGPLIGVLGFNTTRAEHDWPDALVDQLQLIGQIFANALVRKRFELALRESEERLSLAADSADVGFWVLDCRTGVFWTSEKARVIFGYSADQVISMERFEASVHRDDWQVVQGSIERALHAGEPVNVEYRIWYDDSHTRWIASRGRAHFTPTGEPERLMGVSVDITERKLAEQALNERLRFETLLAAISTRFVNAPTDQIDGEINDAQRRICELLDIDRSTLWQISEREPGTQLLTHFHHPPGSLPPPERMSLKDYWPWMLQKILSGETVTLSKITDLPPETDRDRESFDLYGTKSGVYVPLSVGEEEVFGLLTFAILREEKSWPETVVGGFRLVAQVFANALARKRFDQELKKHLEEIEELKQRLEKENICLRDELAQERGFGKIIGNSEALKYVLFRVRQVAPTDATVLILGETGTGKGMVANAIHGLSSRKERPMITVNCAALPANLIESELFGREKGAFTGAHTRQSGRFEAADGGTIFLDEIGELPLDLQSKLLRVLQDGEFERLGSAKTVKVDVRVISSTSRDLKEEVRAGNFREDLFYRLNVFPVTIPPLRERADDIPELVRFFTDKYSHKIGKQIETIPKLALKAMQEYSWPGNVRELEHVIERSVITTEGTVLQLADRLEPIRGAEAIDSSPRDLAAMEREHIVRVLRDTRWKIEGQKGAAKILNLHPSTLRSRIKKLGIKRSLN